MDEKAETPVAMITTDNPNWEEFKTPIENPTKGTKATKNVSRTDETEGTRVSQMGNPSQNVDTVI